MRILKSLYRSRKAWVGVLTMVLTAVVLKWVCPFLGLSPDQASLVAAGMVAMGLALIGGIAYEDGKKGKPPVALLLVCLLPFLSGCATEARHEYTIEACNLVLGNADSMQVLALDYSTGAGAKALQDLKRLDDALMLQIEKIAKTTYTDDKARQAAILEAMTTYKTDVGAVETDKERVRDRDGRFRELVDATKQAAAGLLVVEARTWANKAMATEIIEKAILGKVLSTIQTKGGGK
jgi:hypothetical protein